MDKKLPTNKRISKIIDDAMIKHRVRTIESLAKMIEVKPSTLKNWRNNTDPLNAQASLLYRLSEAAGEDFGEFYRYIKTGRRSPKNNALADHRVARAHLLAKEIVELTANNPAKRDDFPELFKEWLEGSDLELSEVAVRSMVPLATLEQLIEGHFNLNESQVGALVGVLDKTQDYAAADFFEPADIPTEKPTKHSRQSGVLGKL